MSGPFAKLFGRPQLLVDGRELALAPLQLALIGLVFGHEREGLGRAEVATMLWQTGHEGTLRRRLSQLLYELTQAGGDPALLRVGDTLSRPPGSRSELDEVDALFDAGRFREAASIVTRGFLDVLPTVPTSEYQTWLDGRRHALRRLVRARASAQWALAEGQGRWGPRALSSAQALYLLDPANEAAMRNVMWAQALCASPTEALATYDAFFDAHNERTTAPPSTETRTLLQRVRSLARQKSGTAGPVRRGPPEPRMYGREAAVAKLRPLLIDPDEDCLTTVAIAGEAGLGKTRLLNESLSAATLQGRLVLHARLAELEKDVALNALTEALSTREVAEVLARVEEPWRSVVLQFLPEFAQVAGGPLEVPEIQRDSVHRRLLESLRQVFLAIGERHSFVLVLDDLHWIDDSSLAALEYVRRRWDEGAGTIVVTYRPEHVVDGSKLDVFLRSEGVRHLDLQPLDPPSQKQLIGELGGEELSPSAADRIVGLARGNPLFLIELTRQWVEAGAEPFSETATDLSVPTSIRRLFDRRLASLPRAAIRVLEAISVWGRVATLSDLEALAESDADTIANALEDLDRAGLVRWTDQGTELWHELLRQSVLGRISGARRQLLHRRAFNLLNSGIHLVSAGEMAIHCHLSGDRANAFKYSGTAAEDAERKGAISEAIRFLQITYDHAPDLCARAHASLRLATCETLLGLLDRAERRIVELSTELDDPHLVREAGLLLCEIRSIAGKHEALAIASALEALRESAERTHDAGFVLRVLEQELQHADRNDRLHIEAPRALGALERCLGEDLEERLAIAGRVAVLHAFYGDPARAEEITQMVVTEAKTPSERRSAVVSRMSHLAIQGRLGTAEGERVLSEALSLTSGVAQVGARFVVRNNEATYFIAAHDFERAEASLRACDELLSAPQNAREDSRVANNWGDLLLSRRDFGAARSAFSRALQSPANQAGRRVSLVGLGLCDLEAGRLASARSALAKVKRATAELRSPSFDLAMMAHLDARVTFLATSPNAGIERLESYLALAEGRLPLLWLQLGVLHLHLLAKMGVARSDLAEEYIGLATSLNLDRLSRIFANYRNRVGRIKH